ncbi:hypothetical protein PFISCL1PPCAC_3203, partial [Pristionchus fissidentatus]
IVKSFQLLKGFRTPTENELQDDFPDPRNIYELVKALEGKRMRVELSMSTGWSPGANPYIPCAEHLIEINDDDLNVVGKMYCTKYDDKRSFVTKSNVAGFHRMTQQHMYVD